MQRAIIRVTGKVQGVSYRYYSKLKADSLGLSGHVRNDSDGSVIIEIEGQPEGVKTFISWCHAGPPSAQVDSVFSKLTDPAGYRGFVIR